MIRLGAITTILKDRQFTDKISLYFSNKVAGENFDPYEKNYEITIFNAQTILGKVTEITPEALVWKQYGLTKAGAVEIITDAKYANWFRNARKIVIEPDEYSLYAEGLGNRALITNRPKNLIRVVLFKK